MKQNWMETDQCEGLVDGHNERFVEVTHYF